MNRPSKIPPCPSALYPGYVTRNTAFLAATLAFVFVFAAAGAPIPLYNTYRLQDGITNSDFAIVSAIYFIAAASSLIVCGRLSDHVGRRPVALTALLSAALGCGMLSTMHSLTPMLIGRLLQGFACGIASSSLGAYVVDTSLGKPRWLAAAITGSAPLLGIPLGALSSGVLVEWGLWHLCGRICSFPQALADWLPQLVQLRLQLGLWEGSTKPLVRRLLRSILERRIL